MRRAVVRPPYYRQTRVPPKLNRIDLDEVKNLGERGIAGPRLYDYRKMGEIVERLPTVKEKIDFINPFERSWTRFEKNWHRAWMTPLLPPRKAWALPPIPTFFDTLDFYKYITKTRVLKGQEGVDEFEKFYADTPIELSQIKEFERRFSESLACFLIDNRERLSRIENLSKQEHIDLNENINELLRSAIEETYLLLVGANPELLNRRISHTARCESYWIRAGFRHLYMYRQVWEKETTLKKWPMRITCDDRRKLGELSFVMRDKHVVNCRGEKPMKNIFDWSSSNLDAESKAKLHAPVFDKDFDVKEELLYLPKMYNLFPDAGHLWQCPGYDYDIAETHKYGRFAVKNVSLLNSRMCYWKPSDNEESETVLNESLAATSVSSLFNWLNGQAHCLGHTQYTDIQAPLTSQLILADWRRFYFAIGQLNTIAINVDVQGFNNHRTNLCCVEGPFTLYDEFDESTGTFTHIDPVSGASNEGLNEHVIRRLLQMTLASKSNEKSIEMIASK